MEKILRGAAVVGQSGGPTSAINATLAGEPENLFALIVLFFSKVWCHSQKALNKVTFLHSKDTTIYNKERGVQ